MKIQKKTKYLLTTSQDKKVIIAEVPHNHSHTEKEYAVSTDMVQANVASGTFTDMTDKLNWDGRIWILTEDLG